MFRIKQTKNKYSLDRLAKKYYKKLNPCAPKRKTHTLENRIKEQEKAETSCEKKRFYQLLTQNHCANLKKIIIGKPAVLEAWYNRVESLVNRKEILPLWEIKNGKIKSTDFGNEILSLFNYKGQRKSEYTFYWLFKELNILVCPYCGTSYLEFIDTPKPKLRFHIDHFIPKAMAPYLSLSFYNLIPACNNCNSGEKGEKFFRPSTHIHPYIHDFNQWAKFTISAPIISNNLKSFDIQIKAISHRKRIEKAKKDLNLEPIYKNFKNRVIRLDEIKNEYNETAKQSLLNNGTYSGTIFSNREEVLAYIAKTTDIPYNEEEARNKCLGKMRLDLAKEFGILDP